MIEVSTLSTATLTSSASACSGRCAGCGKVHIKTFGHPEDKWYKELLHQLSEALAIVNMPYKLIEVAEKEAAAQVGVHTLPALLIEGQLVSEGRVPDLDDLVRVFNEQKKSIQIANEQVPNRLKKIGVAIDLAQDGSDYLVQYAWSMAQAMNCSLEVVHVMDSMFDVTLPGTGGFLAGYQLTIQEGLNALIERVIGVSDTSTTATLPAKFDEPNPPLRVLSKVLFGLPASTLEAYSGEVDLLLMGMRNKQTGIKKLFGSVSIEVSRHARCPVLLLPADWEYEALEDLVYATNFDTWSEPQMRHAIEFARQFESKIHFVHVDPERPSEDGDKWMIINKLYEASGNKHPFTYKKMISRHIVDALYEYAFFNHANLIVFLLQRRNLWEELMHHSISREAATLAQFPILMLRMDQQTD
jgi:nucleotide-binding universal stress UspA family protein